MNTELFIARKLFFDKSNQQNISRQIINIALVSIALSLAVMIISVSIVTGFKDEVRNKVIGFGGHIQVVNFETNSSPETQPVPKAQPFLPALANLGFVKNIQVFAVKPGIIKTDEDIEGVILKGVDTDYNWAFFKKYLTDGRIPELNDSSRINDILISEKTARLLGFSVGDNVFVYIISDNREMANVRQFTVNGIFNTGLEEFDRQYIIVDIKHIQRLNNWDRGLVGGFEIIIDDFDKIGQAEYIVRELVINYLDENSVTLRTKSIIREFPQIFDWLSILDMNVWVILVLMTLVAGVNMISGLLVLILERSRMIGILKAMGSPAASIRRIFLYLSGFLISRGLIWGNLFGISLIIVQKYLKLIPLDPSSYYVSSVPVNFSLLHLLILNIGTLVAVLAMLVAPSYFIGKISPEKTIRFE